MNADTYLDDVRDSMHETEVNIESSQRPEGGKEPTFANKLT